MAQLLSNPLLAALLTEVMRVGLLALLGLALHQLARRLLPRLVSSTARLRQDSGAPLDLDEESKRRETISHVVLRTTDILIIVVVSFMLLSELGFDLAPLLASAGVIGIALGFGAQTLVKDVFAGLFILLENQYGKGDVVRIADTAGIVEDINLRRTVLRDLDGVVHSVPNGEIRVASNMTRGWSRVNLDITVGYGEDLNHVIEVINKVGADMAADPRVGPMVVEAPKVLRVDEFKDSGIVLKILATTKPITQWDVAGELRLRIKTAFDAEGIEIPYPHQVVILQDARSDASAKAAPADASPSD